jgi:hypothetical protein
MNKWIGEPDFFLPLKNGSRVFFARGFVVILGFLDD